MGINISVLKVRMNKYFVLTCLKSYTFALFLGCKLVNILLILYYSCTLGSCFVLTYRDIHTFLSTNYSEWILRNNTYSPIKFPTVKHGSFNYPGKGHFINSLNV